MVQLGYDSDDEEEGFMLEPVKQKFTIRKPVTPYVCSTPCDFDLEREFLAQEVFPQLEELCQQRGTAFSPIDIQWTPDSIQTESGHLLRINLDFIMRCTPYFICLLGETYGPHRTPDGGKLPESLHTLPDDASWIDKNYLVAASAGYSWILKEVHQNCSIPELEIIQAAFLSDNRYCHFYYRQPEHLDHKLQDIAEGEKQKTIALHKPESEYADLNIRDLKQRIVNKGLPVKYFQTCGELGTRVLADWKEIIDELYPPLLDGLGMFDTEEYREWLCHEVFSESRRHIYLNHSELRTLKGDLTKFCSTVLDEPGLDQEEDFGHYKPYTVSNVLRKQPEVVVKHKSIFVLKADRGMGKSSIVANWVKQFSAEHSEVKVISHFVGCSGRSRDVTTFLRRCISELREEYLTEDDDGHPDGEVARQHFKELCGSFQSAISLGPCVLLIDGVDELGASMGLSPQEIKTFSWIPLPLPPQCRIVVTTLNSDLSHSNLTKRPDTKVMSLSSLSTTKVKAEMLEDHMQMHFDHLKRTQLQTIFESKLSGRPLFLRILGNEMCSYSVYTDLSVYTDTIREMCTSIRDLFVRCFKRWSQDHSWTYEVLSAEQTESDTADFIGWVPDVLRLLAVSRSGLTANEILDTLVSMGYRENVKVTQFDWLMFQLCMGDNITQSTYGMLNFSHQHMREIVEYVLLRIVKPSTAEIISHSDSDKEWKKQKREFNQYLVKYFVCQNHSQRRAEELPWQLLMAGEMKKLAEILAEPQMFESLYDAENRYPSNHYDLRRYWYYLEKEGHSAVDMYNQLLLRLGVLKPEPEKIEVESIEESGSVSDLSEASSTGKSEEVQPPIMLFSPASPNIPSIFTTPASETKLSVIDEASDIMSKDDRGSIEDITNGGDSVFLTQGIETEEKKFDLSPAEVTALTWHVSQFILELGHRQAGEAILMALNSRLMQNYPLVEGDQLIHAKVQECLGQLYLNQNHLDLAEKWYKKALRTVMDMFEIEETSSLFTELQCLKGKVIQQIGCLRLQEGMIDDADDLLEEALDLAEVTHKLTARAAALFHIGTLRMHQHDYLMAETNLRKSLILRQKWYGRNHTLVAEVLYKLGILMADEDNDKGYDRGAASDAFRRCLQIREFHLDKDHIQVAEVLFELGKLLKHETSYCGRAECNSLLTRALDIRITKLGSEHIETRAVRQYLNNLEISLKSAKHDSRSSERPYSSLSWRGHDLANIEKKSRLQSGKTSSYGQVSRPGSQLSRTGSHISRTHSQNISRPVSSQMDFTGATISQKTNLMSYLPASERLMLESTTTTPRLLQRETVHRKLKQKENLYRQSPEISPHSPRGDQQFEEERKHVSIEVESDHVKKSQDVNDKVLLDSYAEDGEKSAVKFKTKTVALRRSPEEPMGRETPPERLYRRFGSPENMIRGGSTVGARSGEVTLRTSEMSLVPKKESSLRQKRPVGSARSARSVGSSLYTSASGASIASHKSNCDIPRGPHSIHISNARSTTMGPHSSVNSLMGDTGPKDISHGIHHKSAWYHVPGRYGTVEKSYAPKRSQRRMEAKKLEKSISPVIPDPYTTFMKSDYRKNNPRMLNKGYPGKGGHTCSKGQTYTPYPRNDKKQYVICDRCQKETEEIIAAQENELLGIVEGGMQEGMMLAPTVNGLTAPDRPRQASYVYEEPIIPDDYGMYQNTGSMVTFKDAVVIN
ncbi:uncharacterized protein LOC123530292 isoform X2 [Mercenaria mercenaria]|uniref:uncharacterized protein LOC123530292 isoform X2 n=1 Tax=Mercenaria mercenaria TaxID=6596 RepID=UPI00234F1CAE|nr:uncharacterized protein LOC123530292 isoform X2 [Mercenaria mercenaria]